MIPQRVVARTWVGFARPRRRRSLPARRPTRRPKNEPGRWVVSPGWRRGTQRGGLRGRRRCRGLRLRQRQRAGGWLCARAVLQLLRVACAARAEQLVG